MRAGSVEDGSKAFACSLANTEASDRFVRIPSQPVRKFRIDPGFSDDASADPGTDLRFISLNDRIDCSRVDETLRHQQRLERLNLGFDVAEFVIVCMIRQGNRPSMATSLRSLHTVQATVKVSRSAAVSMDVKEATIRDTQTTCRAVHILSVYFGFFEMDRPSAHSAEQIVRVN